MYSILVTARYTIIKCIRNPIAVIAFIAAPLLITCMLTGSIDNRISKGVTKLQAKQSEVNLENNIVNTDKGTVSTNDKVTMGSILLFIFYGAVLSSYLIIHDLKNGINTRLKSLPITKIKILLGKSVGSIGSMGIFAVILVIITSSFFHTNWGANKLILFASIALFLIIENSFGIVVTGISKNIYICALITFGVNFFMIFPVYVEAFEPIKIRGALETITKLSFHNYVIKAVTTSSENAIIILCISAAVMFVISLFIGKKVLN